MKSVSRITDAVEAALSPSPAFSSTGAKSGASVEAPYAAEKKPATVTPICTAARKRLGSRATRATRSPRGPRSARALIWPSRSETRAISVPAKTPPTRMKARTSSRLVRVWVSTVAPRAPRLGVRSPQDARPGQGPSAARAHPQDGVGAATVVGGDVEGVPRTVDDGADAA